MHTAWYLEYTAHAGNGRGRKRGRIRYGRIQDMARSLRIRYVQVTVAVECRKGRTSAKWRDACLYVKMVSPFSRDAALEEKRLAGAAVAVPVVQNPHTHESSGGNDVDIQAMAKGEGVHNPTYIYIAEVHCCVQDLISGEDDGGSKSCSL